MYDPESADPVLDTVSHEIVARSSLVEFAFHIEGELDDAAAAPNSAPIAEGAIALLGHRLHA